MPLLVRSLTLESAGVLSVELVDPDGAELPAWEPGAHLDLRLPDAMSRQYSLCGDPADRSRYRLGVLREERSRGGSAYVHDVLRPGDHVEHGGPRNHFRLEPAASYVFVAGGIGITPILPMLAEATSRGADWTLLYGGRTAASMAFTRELAAYGDRVTYWPQDTHGLLDLASLLDLPRP
ncbi:MAG TPA: ferredoxin reductase, partial [Nocardioides sp.]|nr:ferredoxin reductase [Nocardioides sp.]